VIGGRPGPGRLGVREQVLDRVRGALRDPAGQVGGALLGDPDRGVAQAAPLVHRG